uniref:Uncharacterized protein n=1 Tax=Salix viminalis TaxID=40686 RepID=A0A6N2LLP7_SALVM
MANKQHSQLGMGGGLRTEGVDERVKMLLENFKSGRRHGMRTSTMGTRPCWADAVGWKRGRDIGKHHSSPMPATFDDDQDQEDGGGSSSFRFLDLGC